MSDTTIDEDRFRKVMGRLPTGVTIITANHDGEPVAIVIGSFGSASADPPLVMWLVGTASQTWPRIEAAASFCVNVMGAHQLDLCNSFYAKDSDPFAVHEWDEAPSGSPRIAGSAAWIDCEIEDVVEAGDHYIVLGRVTAMEADPDRDPLVFHGGGYHTVQGL